MTGVNHPNRRRRIAAGLPPKPGEVPLPRQIRERREQAELTQEAARRLVYRSLRTWEDWEGGRAAMEPGLWELFCIKTEPMLIDRRVEA